MKRIFGEYVTAGKFANMVKEMIMKAFIYNIFIAQILRLPAGGRPGEGPLGRSSGKSRNKACLSYLEFGGGRPLPRGRGWIAPQSKKCISFKIMRYSWTG